MRTPEQVKWDFVPQWLNRAHKDLVACEVLLKGTFEDFENIGFTHSRRRKNLSKRSLFATRLSFRRSSIALLRQLVANLDPELAKSLAEADALTPYGVEFRYPGRSSLSVAR
jgi:hypothetical protein